MIVPKQLYLGFHTAKRMKSQQISGIAKRKIRGAVLPRLPVDFDHRYEQRVPEDLQVQLGPIAKNTKTFRQSIDDVTQERFRSRTEEAVDGSPTFLNRTVRVADGEKVDWYSDQFNQLPLDWRLKLYAFQPLAWVCHGYEPREEYSKEIQSTFDRWIQDWSKSIKIDRPGYLRRAWTPWAVSLRIIHWSRYLAWHNEEENDQFEQEFQKELYKNVLFLTNHVEWDVGGNHLIENGAALVIAGVLFDNQSWIDAGNSILTSAGKTQFLDDGCHFERSPMYHILTLTRYLTVCDILEQSGQPVPVTLRRTAEKATSYLRYLRPPNGRIPLLNDSVYDQALPLNDCLRYAEAVGVGKEATPTQWAKPVDGVQNGQTAGYHWLRNDAGTMLVDGGIIGPPHLPGHSHSDILNLLLWLDDQAIVTDTGTFGYTGDFRRNYARGVRGHNTVQVGDIQPIALGGKYLMGPRPELSTRFEVGDVSLFEGRYRALPYNREPYTHHRSLYVGERWWGIQDTVSGHNGSSTQNRLHLHPEVEPSKESNGQIRLTFGGDDKTAFVYPLDSTKLETTRGGYFPQFGVVTDRSVLKLSSEESATDPLTMRFLIAREPFDDVGTSWSRDGTTLHLADKEYCLPQPQL